MLSKYLLNECVSDWKITLSLDSLMSMKNIFHSQCKAFLAKQKTQPKQKIKKTKLFSNYRTIRHPKTQGKKGLRLLLDNILQITHILLRTASCDTVVITR